MEVRACTRYLAASTLRFRAHSVWALLKAVIVTKGELDQLADRPFSIREVRGSKPRFSMPGKKLFWCERVAGSTLSFCPRLGVGKVLGPPPAASRLSCSSPRGGAVCSDHELRGAHSRAPSCAFVPRPPAVRATGRGTDRARMSRVLSISFPDGPLCDDVFVHFCRVKWRARLARNVANPWRTRCVRSITR